MVIGVPTPEFSAMPLVVGGVLPCDEVFLVGLTDGWLCGLEILTLVFMHTFRWSAEFLVVFRDKAEN